MAGILRAWAWAIVFLTLLYWLLWFYLRSFRREALEKQADPELSEPAREAWIRAGMQEFDHSLRVRLLALVYILPLAAIAIIIYVVNHT